MLSTNSTPQELPAHIKSYFSSYAAVTGKKIHYSKYRHKIIKLFLVAIIFQKLNFEQIIQYSESDFYQLHYYSKKIRCIIKSSLESLLKDKTEKKAFVSQWKAYLNYFLPAEQKTENFKHPTLQDLEEIEKINASQNTCHKKQKIDDDCNNNDTPFTIQVNTIEIPDRIPTLTHDPYLSFYYPSSMPLSLFYPEHRPELVQTVHHSHQALPPIHLEFDKELNTNSKII